MTEVVSDPGPLEICILKNDTKKLRVRNTRLVIARWGEARSHTWSLCSPEVDAESSEAEIVSRCVAEELDLIKIQVETETEMDSAYPVFAWLDEVSRDARIVHPDRTLLRNVFSPHPKLPVPLDRASLSRGQLEYLEGFAPPLP